MSSLERSKGLAARMGRWSSTHWKMATVGWLAFVVLSLFVSQQLPMKQIDQNDANVGESHTADRLIDQAHFNVDKKGKPTEKQLEFVLLQSKTLTVSSSSFRAAIGDAVRTVEKFPQATELESPLSPAHTDLISADRHSAMVRFVPKGTYEEATKYIDSIVSAVDGVESRHPGFYIHSAGVSTGKQVDEEIKGGLATAGLVSIPLTIAILLLVTGSLVAALVPLLLGITSVVATTGLLALSSRGIAASDNIMEVVLLIGLAVGVDYALFYMRRERQERAAGREQHAALAAAAATSGRAVLLSGMTVLIAMAGLFVSGDKTFMSFSVGTMIVVAVAMIGSLTVLPAVLGKLGDRVEKGRVPFLKRRRADRRALVASKSVVVRGKRIRHRLHLVLSIVTAGLWLPVWSVLWFRNRDRRKTVRVEEAYVAPAREGRLWGSVTDRVLRRPLLSGLVAVGVLVVLAVPTLQIHMTQTGTEGITSSSIEPYKKFVDAFPGSPEPAAVAVKADDVTNRDVRGAIAELKRKALASGQMNSPIRVQVSRSKQIAEIDIPLAGKGVDKASNAALETLRHDLLPTTLGKLKGVEYAVTGTTANSHDWNASQKSSIPKVFAFVLLFAFALLLVSFRSIVIAVKAIVLNLLSVAAAYGVLVALFQWGWAESLFNFESNGGIANWLPMFMFVILFGLSMDYHVFILSRVREIYDRTGSTDEAVSQGIRSTAGVVTSAAVVMVGVFMVFTVLPYIDVIEMGVGLAVAVLIDATIIRAVLLPASMKVLGKANWYLPRWLEWLPRLDHGTAEPVAPAPALKRAA